jgi:hypothetical protein
MAGVHIAEALSRYCVILISMMHGLIVANLQKFHIFVHSLCRKYHGIDYATAAAHDTMKLDTNDCVSPRIPQSTCRTVWQIELFYVRLISSRD